MLGSLQHPIVKAGWTSSFSSEDVFPSASLSAKNFLLMIVTVTRMKRILISQDECWQVMFRRTKWIKFVMIQIVRQLQYD